ncbi:MAG: hypothetical protein V3V08_06355 [Nannocystaceae bacterium]
MEGFPDEICLGRSGGPPWICEVPCHPLDKPCPGDQGCYLHGLWDRFVCATPATPPEADEGDSCKFTGECRGAQPCAPAEILEGCASQRCCTSYCDLNAPGVACSAPEMCVPYFDPEWVAPAFMNLGFCSLVQSEDRSTERAAGLLQER